MVIPKAAHVDFLDVSTLRGPLLDSYYGSALQKEDVGEIAREIMRRYLAKVPRDTGNLASTAKVTYHRAKGHRDKRWESEFSVGGPRAPYVVPLEAEKHYLDDALREMGFNMGDAVDGPQGRVAKEHREPPDKRVMFEPRGRESDAGLIVPGGGGRRGGGASSERGRAAVEAHRIAKAEREAGLDASSTRVRAGLYDVSGGGRKFTVEQRRDIPGAPWRASDPEAFHDPHIGDFSTKGEAVAALRDIIRRGGEQ